jgi:hypothetical protein
LERKLEVKLEVEQGATAIFCYEKIEIFMIGL